MGKTRDRYEREEETYDKVKSDSQRVGGSEVSDKGTTRLSVYRWMYLDC